MKTGLFRYVKLDDRGNEHIIRIAFQNEYVEPFLEEAAQLCLFWGKVVRLFLFAILSYTSLDKDNLLKYHIIQTTI